MYEFQKRCLDGIYICLRGDYIQDPETGKMMGSRPFEKFDKSGDSGIIKAEGEGELEQAKKRDHKILVTDIAIEKIPKSNIPYLSIATQLITKM